MKNLFQYGKFTSAAGKELDFKIECDALTEEDWYCLGQLITDRVQPFSQVLGVPTGGYPLVDALWDYQKGGDLFPVLVVDDVWTTGKSMLEFVEKNNIKEFPWIGYVAFARGPITHPNVKALFTLEN